MLKQQRVEMFKIKSRLFIRLKVKKIKSTALNYVYIPHRPRSSTSLRFCGGHGTSFIQFGWRHVCVVLLGHKGAAVKTCCWLAGWQAGNKI